MSNISKRILKYLSNLIFLNTYFFFLRFTNIPFFKTWLGNIYMYIFRRLKKYKVYGPKNVKLIFPHKTENEVTDICSSSAYQIFDTMCSFLNIRKIPLEEIKARSRLMDKSTADSIAFAINYMKTKKRGLIFVGLHHHHWLIGPVITKALINSPVANLIKKSKHSATNNWLVKKASNTPHMKVFQQKDENDRNLLIKLKKFLDTPGILFIAADFESKKQAKFFDFLGIPTAYNMGPFNLALLAKAPIFFASCQQVEEDYDVLCYPIITDFPELRTKQQKEEILDYIARKYVQYHEAEVLRDPGGSVMWVTQKRWQYSPPSSDFVPLSYNN